MWTEKRSRLSWSTVQVKTGWQYKSRLFIHLQSDVTIWSNNHTKQSHVTSIQSLVTTLINIGKKDEEELPQDHNSSLFCSDALLNRLQVFTEKNWTRNISRRHVIEWTKKTRTTNRERLIDEISIKRETEVALLCSAHLKNLRSIDDQTQMLFFKELTFIIC